LILDIAQVGKKLIAVGERGHVLLSGNQGTEWTQARVPTRSGLNAVFTTDDERIWAVGHDAVIVHSGDGGKTWKRQFYAPELEMPLFDVWFENARHGLAVGAYGLVLETFDGGGSWERRVIHEEEVHHYSLAPGPKGALYCVGEFGTILRSRDRGDTWTRVASPYEGTFFGVGVLGDDSVLAFGLRGTVFRSRDEGESWEKVETGTTVGLFGVIERADGIVSIVGQSGTILESTDSSRTFQAGNIGHRKALATGIRSASGKIIVVGDGGFSTLDSTSQGNEK
jgi:photosystem II stability/assembly factor-like uncharacterized protein